MTSALFSDAAGDGRIDLLVALEWGPARRPARLLVEVCAGSGYLAQSAPCIFLGGGAQGAELALHVRWSDGRKSRHPVPDGAARVVLRAPRIPVDPPK